ncbi:hypothetical protein PG997_005683 [Apiospora hydei]|uniref:Uncharacterized protein n=1 Tax=Apiospora hydei TaxID=1337664 RepID=A0ABR1WN20_9PEZI
MEHHDTTAHTVDELRDTALSTRMQPTIESPDRTVSVFICHWDSDAENYAEIDSGIHALRKTFEHQYGFSTEVHELEQAKSGSKNQLTLMSRFLPLLYDTSPDPMMPCRCLDGMHRYLHKPEEVNLFIFIYLGFAETASDGSCLLRPVGQPDQDPASLPSVKYSSISRATIDMGESQVLALLDCPYDGPSTSAMSANKGTHRRRLRPVDARVRVHHAPGPPHPTRRAGPAGTEHAAPLLPTGQHALLASR